MTPFDILKSLNSKDYLLKDPNAIALVEVDYYPFMINRGMSYFRDTIFFANEMNKYGGIPKVWQYDFYFHGVSKKKRFSEWFKKDKNAEDIELLKIIYNYSTKRALEALELLNDTDLVSLRATYNRGGR